MTNGRNVGSVRAGEGKGGVDRLRPRGEEPNCRGTRRDRRACGRCSGSGTWRGGTGKSCSPASADVVRLVDEDRQPWAPGKQIRGKWCGVQHMLEVVEHEQRETITEDTAQTLASAFPPVSPMPSDAGNRRRHERRIADRCEGDDHQMVGIGVRRGRRRSAWPAGSCRPHRDRSASPIARPSYQEVQTLPPSRSRDRSGEQARAGNVDGLVPARPLRSPRFGTEANNAILLIG